MTTTAGVANGPPFQVLRTGALQLYSDITTNRIIKWHRYTHDTRKCQLAEWLISCSPSTIKGEGGYGGIFR